MSGSPRPTTGASRRFGGLSAFRWQMTSESLSAVEAAASSRVCGIFQVLRLSYDGRKTKIEPQTTILAADRGTAHEPWANCAACGSARAPCRPIRPESSEHPARPRRGRSRCSAATDQQVSPGWNGHKAHDKWIPCRPSCPSPHPSAPARPRCRPPQPCAAPSHEVRRRPDRDGCGLKSCTPVNQGILTGTSTYRMKSPPPFIH